MIRLSARQRNTAVPHEAKIYPSMRVRRKRWVPPGKETKTKKSKRRWTSLGQVSHWCHSNNNKIPKIKRNACARTQTEALSNARRCVAMIMRRKTNVECAYSLNKFNIINDNNGSQRHLRIRPFKFPIRLVLSSHSQLLSKTTATKKQTEILHSRTQFASPIRWSHNQNTIPSEVFVWVVRFVNSRLLKTNMIRGTRTLTIFADGWSSAKPYRTKKKNAFYVLTAGSQCKLIIVGQMNNERCCNTMQLHSPISATTRIIINKNMRPAGGRRIRSIDTIIIILSRNTRKWHERCCRAVRYGHAHSGQRSPAIYHMSGRACVSMVLWAAGLELNGMVFFFVVFVSCCVDSALHSIANKW